MMKRIFLTIVLSAMTLPLNAADTGLTQDQIESIAIQPADGKLRDAMLQLFTEETLHYTQGEKLKNTDIKYRLHSPEKSEPGKKYPLVLWLHGAGENGDDNKKNLIHLHHVLPYLTGTKQRDFFLLVPQCSKTTSWYPYLTVHSEDEMGLDLDDWINNRRYTIEVPVKQNDTPWYYRLFNNNGNIQLKTYQPNQERTWGTTFTTTDVVDNVRIEEDIKITIVADTPKKMTVVTKTIKEGKETAKTQTFEGEKTIRQAFRSMMFERFKKHYPRGQKILETKEVDGVMQYTVGNDPDDTGLGISLAILDDLMKRYPVDADRISVSGLSSGGEAVWAFLEAKPELFASGVPIVSWRTWNEETLKAKPLLKEIPVWSIYSSDDNSIDNARKNFDRVFQAGCNVKKTEFGVCGHNGWTPAMLQADVFSFMLSRGKKDGAYVQVADPKVKPEDLKGIVEVATRDKGQPKLAPAVQPADSGDRQEKKSVEIQTSEGDKVEGVMIEDCDRPWAMTSDSQYGLFAADWMKEAKALPPFVFDLTVDELSKRLSKSVSGDGKDIAEVCRSLINMERKPASNPFFNTSGGRLRSDIQYTLSPKGEMLERLLRTVNDSKNDLADIADKTLEKMKLLVQ